MRITINRESFQSAFNTAKSVVKSNNAKSVFGYIKLEVTGDSAFLTASDSELRLRVELSDFEIEEPGKVLLPVAKFVTPLTETNAEKITIASEGTKTLLLVGRSKFQFPTDDPADFPPIEPFTSEGYFVFNGKQFSECISQTIFACDSEKTGRAIYGGILLTVIDDKVHFVATDTRRMSHTFMEFSSVGSVQWLPETDPVIPKSTMMLIERIYSGSETLMLALGMNKLTLSDGRVTFYAQQLDGKFPDWHRVFPTNPSHQVQVEAGVMLSAIKQAQVVVTRDSPGVDFRFEDKLLTLFAHTPENGECNISIDVAYDEELFAVKLLPEFVRDFLMAVDAKSQVDLILFEGNRPVIMRLNNTIEYAIMPLIRPRSVQPRSTSAPAAQSPAAPAPAPAAESAPAAPAPAPAAESASEKDASEKGTPEKDPADGSNPV